MEEGDRGQEGGGGGQRGQAEFRNDANLFVVFCPPKNPQGSIVKTIFNTVRKSCRKLNLFTVE